MLRKLTTFLALILLLACGPAVEESESTLSITPNIQIGPCASGYSRLYPNFCAKNTINSTGGLTVGGCQSINLVALWGVPSSSVVVKVDVVHSIVSQNTAGLRSTRLNFFTDSICTGLQSPTSGVDIREQVATAGSVLLYADYQGPYDMRSTNGLLYYTAQLTTCTSCTITVQLYGYYD